MQQHYTREATLVKDDELASRRERGRRAQREFRRRQINTINELQASKAAMQAAIASIARVATQLDSAEMTAAVRDACRVAGLETSEESDVSSVDRTSCSVHNECPVQESSEIAVATTISWAQEPGNYRSGRMSPTLGYGLWFGPEASISVEYPPMDIIPYLQDGSSLAITVFWTSLSWGFQILGAALEGNVEAVAMAQKIFSAILPISPGRDVLHGIHARLTYRKTGTIDRNHPGNKPEQAPGILAAMTRSCEDNGTPLETFLTPIAMESLLRNRLGPAYDVIDRSVRGFGSPEEIARLRGLIQVMTMSSICLGDGPRWSAEKSENVIEYWIHSAGL